MRHSLTQRLAHNSPIHEKILGLTSWEAKYRLAGSKKQRKSLRIPLASTRCGKDSFFLWQIDIAIDETGLPQQVIKGEILFNFQLKMILKNKVWGVGNSAEVESPIIPSLDYVLRKFRSPRPSTG